MREAFEQFVNLLRAIVKRDDDRKENMTLLSQAKIVKLKS